MACFSEYIGDCMYPKSDIPNLRVVVRIPKGKLNKFLMPWFNYLIIFFSFFAFCSSGVLASFVVSFWIDLTAVMDETPVR